MQTIVSIHPRSNRLRILVIVALVALLMPWIGSQPAHAAGKTFSVNSTLDEPDAVPSDGNCVSVPAGVCTLRAAIMEANLWPGDDIIILQPNKTYLLTRAGSDDMANLGDLDIVQNLTINVSGGGSAIIDGNGGVTNDRVFQIMSTISVTISGLTIKNGKPARDGGGIYNAGALTLNKSTVSGNTANYSNGGPFVSGGGIYNIGTLGLSNSTVSGNTTNGGWGGGIYNAGTMTLTNSTISGNHASESGGGIYVVGGTVQLYNATIAYNRADSDSSGNGDGGGIFNSSGGTVSFKNTLIAGNKRGLVFGADDDCVGTLTSADYNLIETTAGCAFNGTTTHNKTGVNPQLGALQNNGGPTFTHALSAGSAAIDAGNPLGCKGPLPYNLTLTADQRGQPRPTGTACDIGAYEAAAASQNPIPSITSLSPNTAIVGGPDFTLTVNGANFANSAIVRWNGANRTTAFGNSTKLTAQIAAADIAQVGSVSVTVYNPAPGGGASNAASFTINKQNQMINFAPLPNKTVGDPPFAVSASASSGLPVTFTASAQCSVNGTTVTLSGQAGSCTITAHQGGNATYNPAPDVARTFQINDPAKQNQTINFAPLPNKMVGDPPFPVSATASSGLNVTFTASGKCSVNGTIVTLSGQAGSCTITAHQAGNATYNPAADVARTFQIQAPAKQNQTINFAPLPNKTVGDPPFAVSASASSGLAVTFTASGKCSVNGTTVTLSGQAGSCTITAHQAGNATYNPAPDVARSFAVNDPAKQNQAINFAPLPNKTGGDPPFMVSATASSGLPISFTASGQCAVVGTSVTLTGAGSCTITAHQAGNATYNPAADVARTFQISTSGGGGAGSHTVYLPLIVKAPPLAPAPSLANGDFERGATGWTVSSTFSRNVIRTTFVGSVVPHSGTYAAWLGGRYNETTAIQQQVTITGGAPYLAYWQWIASIDVCNHDRGSVRVNGAIVQSYDLCWSTSTHGWVKHVVNLSAYAGQSVTLRIQASADATLNSNLFIDDVGFQSTPSGAGQVQSLASDDSAQALSETGDE